MFARGEKKNKKAGQRHSNDIAGRFYFPPYMGSWREINYIPRFGLLVQVYGVNARHGGKLPSVRAPPQPPRILLFMVFGFILAHF